MRKLHILYEYVITESYVATLYHNACEAYILLMDLKQIDLWFKTISAICIRNLNNHVVCKSCYLT